MHRRRWAESRRSDDVSGEVHSDVAAWYPVMSAQLHEEIMRVLIAEKHIRICRQAPVRARGRAQPGHVMRTRARREDGAAHEVVRFLPPYHARTVPAGEKPAATRMSKGMDCQ